ncbi:hypothetical protein JHK86_034063 [Glycine max]|nr:hypothetical protein JHK86_034063 [Glycine max]
MEKLDWKANSTQAKSIGTLVSIAGALIITLYKGQAVIKNHPSNKLFPKKHVSSEQFDWVIGAVLLAGHSFAIIGVSLRSIVHIWVMSKKGPLYVAMFKPIGIIFAVIIGIAFLGDSIYLGSVLGTAIVVIGFYAIIWGKSQEQAKEECKVYDDSESYSPIVRYDGLMSGDWRYIGFGEIDRPLASLYNLKSGKFRLAIHQSLTIHCHPSMNLTKFWNVGFPGIDHFSYSSWDTLLEEEYTFGVYGNKELVVKEFPSRQTATPDPNILIFQHWPTDRKMYPPGASVWKSRESESAEMPFSTPLDL